MIGMCKKVFIFVILLLLFLGTTIEAYNKRSSKTSVEFVKMSALIKKFDLYYPRWIMGMSEILKLSDTQIEKIEKMKLNMEKFIIQNGAQIKIAELELVALLSDRSINRTKIEKKIRAVGNLKTALFLKYFDYLFDIKGVLTPEQIDKIKATIKRKKSRRGSYRKSPHSVEPADFMSL